MLGLFIPDALQVAFVEVARGSPVSLQRLVFVVLCCVYLIVFAFILRRALLYVDAATALAARRQGGTPGALTFAAGHCAIWQARIIVALTAVLLLSATVFELGRTATLPIATDGAVYQSARYVQSCLRPASRAGEDRLLPCVQ